MTAGAASGQATASLTVQSDYLLRGVSLSDGRPTLGLSATYDAADGAYGAVTLTATDTRQAGAELLGFIVDAGYARRLANGMSWDVGVTDSQVSTYVEGRYIANYAEVYGGLARGGLSARLFFSPGYLGESVQTLYLDLAGAVRPAPRWRLFAHAGLLEVVGGSAATLGGRSHVDLQAGVGRAFGPVEARLAASWIGPAPVYPEGVRHRHGALTASASVYF